MHPSPSTLAPGRSKAAAVFRVTAGNFLEQFDFFLFGFYATQIAGVFFPAGSEFASLMMTFAVFGPMPRMSFSVPVRIRRSSSSGCSASTMVAAVR